jgi:hypothetical protein
VVIVSYVIWNGATELAASALSGNPRTLNLYAL